MENKKNILITREIPEVAKNMLLSKDYVVDVSKKNKNLSKREIISLLKKKSYDAVLSLLTDHIDADIFEAGKSVKIYSNYASGFDNIDIVEAKKRGIMVANAPAEMTLDAVAEHVIALMFALGKRVVEADRFVRAGKYKGWVPLSFLGADMSGKTLGLIGAGKIGERVADRAGALGLKIIYTDVVRNPRLEKKWGAVYMASLNELLPLVDFASLHVPLLPSTKHLINKKSFELMRRTAYLINTSRGPVVDEKALEKALKDNTIAGAGLDVFEFEPKISSGLKKLQNVVLTPHIASASAIVRNQMAEIAAQNIIDFLEGKKPKYAVNL